MNDIRTLLKIAARRLELISFISRLHLVAIIAGAVGLALILADRATAARFVPWQWVGPGLAMLAIGIAGILWVRRRQSEIHVAVEVDERLDLREKLSTALHCQGRTDAFAQAAIEDAVNAARDPRTREQLKRRFGIVAPRGWWVSPIIVLTALILSLLPQLNLFAKDNPAADPNVVQAKVEAEEALEAVIKAIEKKPEVSKELTDLLGELSKEGIDPNALKTPEELKRDVIKKITDVSKKLDDLVNGEKSKTKEALEKSLSQIQPPESGEAKELAEAMAKGDFKAAQEKLQQLMEKAQNGQMNDEQKQQLADQMKNLAEQLEKLAEQQKQLEEALKQAGMDPQLANNPQALQQAIQQNQNLNQQQKQQLQQQAAAQQAACKMCQGLGQACQQMAQGLGKQGQQGQMGQGAQAMMEQLNAAEQLEQLLQQAQAAAQQCQGQCQGLGQNLALQQLEGQGGMGQRGQGRGGKAPIAPTPTATRKQFAETKSTNGDIIAKMLFDGPQVVGESKAKLISVVEEAREGFDEAVQEDLVPLKYHDALKHYAGELDAFTKAIEASEGDKKAEPAAAPAEQPAESGASGAN